MGHQAPPNQGAA